MGSRMRLYRERLARGDCGGCGCRPAMEGKTRCKVCDDRKKKGYLMNRAPNVRNKAEIVANPMAHLRASAKYRMRNREQTNAATRRSQMKKRLEVLEIYGGECRCCGERRFEFLQFDHIEGNGRRHREAVGSGYKFLLWLQRNSYPKSIQILCSNCNFAKGHYGICPHERERMERNGTQIQTRSESVQKGQSDITTGALPEQIASTSTRVM